LACALVFFTFSPILASCGPSGTPAVKASLPADARNVRSHGGLTLTFDRPMDKASVEGGLELSPPALSQSLEWITLQRLRLNWRLEPGHKYLLKVAGARGQQGKQALTWTLRFSTASAPTVTGVEVDGKALAENQREVSLRPRLGIRFSEPMDPRSVPVTLDGRPVREVAWGADRRSLTFSAPLAAGARHVLRWSAEALSVAGEPPRGAWEFGFSAAPALPGNGHALSGNPMLVQVEDSQPSRPQFGLQQADLVYEYLSEYEISRFTVIYWGEPPAVVGPVRSARLISIALQEMFHGSLFSSGASGPVSSLLARRPAFLGTGGIGFYRERSRYAPHNLMISGQSLLQHRSDFGDLHPNFGVDVQHPDVEWPSSVDGTEIDVPLHHVHWHYVPEEGVYTRTDHGTPFLEGSTGQPLRAKNVIIQTVRWWTSNIVEDGCCTRGLDYQMTGEGDAIFFANGQQLAGRWRHLQGAAPMQFLDRDGNPVALNSGLTWVHVR